MATPIVNMFANGALNFVFQTLPYWVHIIKAPVNAISKLETKRSYV